MREEKKKLIEKEKEEEEEERLGCLVDVFKQQFSVFKQYYIFFHTFFHSHVFPHMFSNNNFQFLSACTKHPNYVN